MKRRILAILLTMCICLSMFPAGVFATEMTTVTGIAPQADFRWEGSGTEDNPYKISSKEDLETLADAVNNNNDFEGLYFEQTGDIDLKGDSWSVIGHVIGNTPHPFNGVYNGGDHNIYGLFVGTLDAEGEPVGILNEDAGLFGHVGEKGVIRRVHVVDCKVYSKALYVGGIAGRNEGLVEYCSSDSTAPDAPSPSGVLKGSWQYVGGIVGYNFGKISYCYSNCDVYGAQKVGGITGGQNGGTVVNCYFRGYIYADDITRAYAGGIAGENDGDSTIDNCYCDGIVEGRNDNAYCGAIAGSNDTGSTVGNCFWESSDDMGLPGIGSGMGDVENVEARTPDEFTSGQVAWELAHGTDGDGWGQTLDDDDGHHDNHPHFTDAPDKDYDTTAVYRVTLRTKTINETIYVDPDVDIDLSQYPLPNEQSKWYVVDENGDGIMDETGLPIIFDGNVTNHDVDAVGGERILFAGETDTVIEIITYSTEEQILDLDVYMQYAEGGPLPDGRFEYSIIEDVDDLKVTLSDDGKNIVVPAGANVKDGGYTLKVNAHESKGFIAPLALGPFGTDDVVLTVRVVIEKATPIIDPKPTASEVEYGKTLDEIPLTDGAAHHPMTNVDVDGKFSWTSGDTVPNVPKAASVGYPVTFIPTDTNNYNNATVMVTFTVHKVDPDYEKPTAIDSKYNGRAQELIKEKGSAVGGTMMYSLDENGEYSIDSPARANTGEYAVYYKIIGDENHNDIGPFYVTAVISCVELDIPSQTVVYNGSNTLTLTLEGVNAEDEDSSRTVVAVLTAADKAVGTYEYAGAAADGKYTVALSNDNYIVGSAGVLEIVPLPVALVWEGNLTVMYDGTKHNVSAKVTNAVDGDEFKLEYEDNEKTYVGDYTAKLKELGNNNYTLKNAQNAEQVWHIYQESEHVVLTADKNPIRYGDKLTLKLRIEPSEENGIMTLALLRDQVEFCVNGKSVDIVDVEYDDEKQNSATVTITVDVLSSDNFSVGANAVTAMYSGNSNVRDGMDAVTVTVEPKQLTAKIDGSTDKTYDGNNVAAGLDIKLEGVENCDKDDVTAAADSYTYDSQFVTKATVITANNVTLSGKQSGNYTVSDPTEKGSIAAKIIRLEWSGYQELVYNGSAVNVTATATEIIPGDECEVAVTNGSKVNAGKYVAEAEIQNSNYKLPDDNKAQDYTIEPVALYIPEKRVPYNGTEVLDIELSGVVLADGTEEKVYVRLTAGSADVGEYEYALYTGYGKYVVSGIDSNYFIAGGALLTIEKIDPEYTPPTAKNLKYNGNAQVLAEAGSANGGTMEYSLSPDGPWTAEIESLTGKEAGDYTIWYRVVGDKNHNDIPPNSVAVNIASSGSSKPGGFVTPSKPSEPSDPDDPSGPSDTDDPIKPDTPDDPVDPSDPTTPDTPSDPTDPVTPDITAEPSEPTDRDDPTKADDTVNKPDASQNTDNVPKTGDNSNIAIWTVWMLLSLIGMAAALPNKRRFASTDRHSR